MVHSNDGRDLLSVLLNKGNKLREEMIVSSLENRAKTDTGHLPEDTEIKQIAQPVELDDPNLSLRLVSLNPFTARKYFV